MKVLVIEDEKKIASFVRKGLEAEGFVVDVSNDGNEGYSLATTHPYDVVVLDIMLPGRDGLSILRNLREKRMAVPVILLTARSELKERLEGLNLGADDYLAKPFELEELLARVEALIRRAAGHASPVLECGPVRLDTSTNRVTLDGNLVELTAQEFRTLSYLMYHGGKVISKTELSEHIYGLGFDSFSNVIEVLINRLRKKLGADLIRTHRGRGYQLVVPANAS